MSRFALLRQTRHEGAALRVPKGETPTRLSDVWEKSASCERLTGREIFRHHLAQAWRGAVTAPVTALLTLLTIAVALFLYGFVLLAVSNLQTFVGGAQQQLAMTIYLKDDISSAAAEKLKLEITGISEVGSVKFVSKDAALAQFRKSLGADAAALDGLENANPIPASLEVMLKPAHSESEDFARIAERYRGAPGVERVAYSEASVAQIGRIAHALTLTGYGVLVMLVVITMFIMVSTITLALYAHREEIEIMRLVGATYDYIRAPYLIEGFFQGLGGAILALVSLLLCFNLVAARAHESELLSALFPHLHFLGWGAIFGVMVLGVVVGIGGSFLAVRRFSIF